MRYAIIAVMVLVRIIFGCPQWLAGTDVPYILRALSYNFFHAGWLHLAVNALAVWSVFSPLYRRRNTSDLFTAFVIAVLVYPLSFRPVVGVSNVLYAALGLRTPPLSSPWWKRPQVIVFLAVTVGMVFIPRFSATTHIAAFLAGMLVTSIRRFSHKIDADARRCIR